MTLEDFFTLTEMKDGLTAPSRVQELVNVMQNERDCVVKNVDDLTRQRATVASTLVATDDKECLDLFINLDGIGFIHRWLKDAENCFGDASHSFVEESMAALLCALLKLNIDNEKAKSCGIWLTVKNLLDHSSNKVQNKARALFDSWNIPVIQDVGKAKEPSTDLKQVDLDTGGSTKESSLLEDDTNEEKHIEPAEVEEVPASNSGVLPSESSVDVHMQASDKPMIPDHEVANEDCTLKPVGPSVVLEPLQESLSSREKSPGLQVDETKEVEICTSTIAENGFEGKADVSESNEFVGKSEEEQTVNLPSKLGSMLISSVSTPVDSSDCAIDAKQNSYLRGSPSCDMDMVMVEDKNEKHDSGSGDNCRSTMVTATESHHSGSGSGSGSGSDTSFSTGDSGRSSREKEPGSDESEDLENHPNFLKTGMRAEDRGLDKRSSFSELDFGMVDALEVARQVAIEAERGCGDPSESSSERISDGAPVAAIEAECREATGNSSDIAGEVARRVAIEAERKVTGHGEPSGSSSERITGIAMRQPESAESVTVAFKDGPPGSNLSSKTLADRVELSSTIKDLDAERENRLQDLESSQVTEAAQDRGLCNFDLNQEISSEDMDRLPARRASTPISVVSASRAAAAAPRLPVAPLQFEGALGWKGSAATSAFRPTLARRISETSNSSKQRRDDCLDFDLNVAEVGDEPISLIPPGKTNLGLSGLPPFHNSSMQADPGKSKKLKLDLNLMSDDVDTPSDSRLVQPRISHRNLSPPALKNFDLNDQPSFFNDPLDLQPSRGKSSFNPDASTRRPGNSVISIMGTKVEINRKDPIPYMSSLPNGNSGFDASFGRSGGVSGMGSAVQYGHPHMFGYNGLAAGSPAVGLSPSMYGPGGHVQYMVDSRGVPVLPQLMGSAYSRPPFVMNMIGGMPPGPNGPGPSQQNFDLSSGLVIDEGNRQPGVLRQLLDPSQGGRSVDEQLRGNTQSFLGPSGLGKRKEPEDGWEPYPQYRNHRQPPWN